MPVQEKIPYMVQWYRESEDLLRGCGLCLEEIDKTVKKSKVELRDGTDTMFSTLAKEGIPVLVFSAGIGDVVESILRHYGIFHDNVKIISNFLSFNDGLVNGFKGELIHVFNKNECTVESHGYFKPLIGRVNVILMGDVLGDAKMAEGVHDLQNLLRIGYLYEKAEASLESFKNEFDIVIVDDQTMDVPNSILQQILFPSS